MSGIEKVCEYKKDGHWYGPDTFWVHDPKSGKSIYRNTIQVCPGHIVSLRKQFKGKDHVIVVQPPEADFFNDLSDYSRDFELFVDGVPNPFTVSDGWMRWYNDKRHWRRNMKKLLGVSQLNIERIDWRWTRDSSGYVIVHKH